MDNFQTLPHQVEQFNLPKFNLPKDIKEAYLNLNWTRKEPTNCIDTFHIVAYDQFILAVNKKAKATPFDKQKIAYQIDKQTGAINSLKVNGKEMLHSPVLLSLYRPGTDNDKRDAYGANVWRAAGLHQLKQKAKSIQSSKNTTVAEVELINEKEEVVATAQITYTLVKNKDLKVTVDFKPDTNLIKALARIGFTFEMPQEYHKVSYLGRGDVETYADRKQAGRLGIYETSAFRMFHYYVMPQSTGNRTDVRWGKIYNAVENGIGFDSSKPFQFSVIPFEDELVDQATHLNQLEDTGIVTVHLDAEQSGVGTATCGPGVLPQYRVPVQDTSFEFTLYGL